MKKISPIYLILFVVITILGTACYNFKEFKNRSEEDIAFLASITRAEMKLIKESRESRCNLEEQIKAIKSCTSGGTGTCDKTPIECCEDLTFCSLSERELKQYLKNYRDEDWIKTCDYYSNNAHDIANIRQLYQPSMWTTSNPNPLLDISNFDARFTDLPIDQLESYLCAVKNSPNMEEITAIRCYYIRYNKEPTDQFPFNPNYANKHTLALVPVSTEPASNGNVTNDEFTKGSSMGTFIWSPMGGNCKQSPVANHSQLCPPFECGTNTMLEKIDAP